MLEVHTCCEWEAAEALLAQPQSLRAARLRRQRRGVALEQCHALTEQTEYRLDGGRYMPTYPQTLDDFAFSLAFPITDFHIM